jgi:hypothetical protein
VDPGRVPLNATTEDFEPLDHFYLLRWARDLKHVFPLLDPDREPHPYRLFYLIWKLSYAFGRTYADHSVCFERLAATPAETIRDLLEACRLDASCAPELARLVESAPIGRWRSYAPAEWFEAHESHCESLLARRRFPDWPPALVATSAPGGPASHES